MQTLGPHPAALRCAVICCCGVGCPHHGLLPPAPTGSLLPAYLGGYPLTIPVALCAAWRPSIEDPGTLQLFIDFYIATQPPLSNMALECLVGAVGVYWCSVAVCEIIEPGSAGSRRSATLALQGRVGALHLPCTCMRAAALMLVAIASPFLWHSL